MVVTLSWASVVSVAGVIVAIGSAWKVILEAKKAWNKPYKDIESNVNHYDKCLINDNERLKNLELSFGMLSRDNEIELKALSDVVNHLSTHNNTGEMKRVEDDIDDYLRTRVNNIQL